MFYKIATREVYSRMTIKYVSKQRALCPTPVKQRYLSNPLVFKHGLKAFMEFNLHEVTCFSSSIPRNTTEIIYHYLKVTQGQCNV
jgi:hypothetical protein